MRKTRECQIKMANRWMTYLFDLVSNLDKEFLDSCFFGAFT